jgi:L-asparaginase / beta-aspartyl-peptidase
MRNLKLFRRTNCFFSVVLFSAGALAAAPEQSPPAGVFSKRNPDHQQNMETQRIGLAIHGGAGTIDRGEMTPEREGEYRAGLERALTAGYEILKRGGSSLDATEAAVRVLEDDPHFNAGKGSVFTSAGTNEMDAAIMDGKTLAAGAVASLKHIKNPISLARLVMEKSGHVMMDSEGAESFAKENGIELVNQKYFFTQKRWDALQKIKAAERSRTSGPGKEFLITDQDRHGTVGAVALDQSGNLAAATSTGGTTNKRPGRVGDTPVIGAGTYANNATCAVSATGDGEYFIRATVGRDVSALIEYRGMSLKDAAQAALDKVAKLGGTGGLIAIDGQGNVTLPFNTAGMYRGYLDPNGKFVIEIYR